ncbi:DUF1684 domain-containing protein [Runella sp. SP2]|uniref:DUF1684 domain-containing protein n=1 Tax=Runella sp. SP2 TaxID=2268026 RepID=UPI000F08B224|nr:DUF1684 domain-containing protein [Runella sp. SP2]AYQ32016.1 DUF1684 domain-containing protein [Runella sp. SP2]
MKTNSVLLFLALVFSALFVGFISKNDEGAYQNEINQWHQKRMDGLKSEDGWLNLAGLFWLKEGDNTFGSDEKNDIVFPKKASKQVGTLVLRDGKVSFKAHSDAQVKLLEAGTSPEFVFEDGKTTTMQEGTLRWFIIKRGPKYGIRLRDLEHPVLSHFQGVERFSVNEAWKVVAKLEKPSTPRTIAITDVLGLVSQQSLVGHAVFEWKGKTYRLAATDAGGGRLFIIFKDKTTSHETYGAGRFLYTDKPDEAGNVILDFNKAINPPCAFSPYATCPLPPAENNLAIRIEAGEKDAKMH